LRKLQKKAGSRAENIFSLQEMLSGFSVIKAFARKIMKSLDFRKTMKNITVIHKDMSGLTQDQALLWKLSALRSSIVLWFGGKDVVNGVWSSGSFVAFLGAVFSMYQPLKKFFRRLNSSIQQAVTASERIFEILDQEPTIVDSASAVEMPRFSQSIVYKDVSFDYGSGKQILNKVNITIPFGQTVAFVGSSGSGKTTIANLLLRFYDVKSGELLMTVKIYRILKLNSLRSQLGVCLRMFYCLNDYGKIQYIVSEA
jgi:subfamily B ATP-binding cassette protein MsbA